MKKLFATALLLLFALVPALSAQEKKSEKKRDPGLYAHFDTTLGSFVIRLHEKRMPKTVQNFVDLATGKKPWRDSKTGQIHNGEPFYDGVIFHRVMKNFMSQTGSHLPDGSARIAENIPDEFHSGLRYNKPGVVGMANAGPNTGSSAFFITHGPREQLNKGYPIFGQVVEGLDIVLKMSKVNLLTNSRGERAIPMPPIIVKKVRIERVE